MEYCPAPKDCEYKEDCCQQADALGMDSLTEEQQALVLSNIKCEGCEYDD